MTLKVLIVEDELVIAELAQAVLDGNPSYEVSGMARNYDEAINELTNNKPDFVILDINLGSGKTGIDVGKFIRENEFVPFIFLTSNADQATIKEARETLPLGYVVKPFTGPSLFAAIEVAMGQVEARQEDTKSQEVTLKDGYSLIKLKVDDILWMKADNIYVEIHTTGDRHVVRQSLKSILEDWDIDDLQQVHRSYAVNVHHIEKMEGNDVYLANRTFPVSRTYRPLIRQALGSK